MYVLRGNGVNDLYPQGVALLAQQGEKQPSRAGEVLVLPAPLAITYERPWERVLFDETRNANPFMNLFESLWLLAGRNDAKWLDQFVHDFSSRFAEEDGRLHGSYGYRWRKHFDMEGEGQPWLPDQINTIVERLKRDPYDRRVVLQMWDPVADLGSTAKDVPCNLVVLPRIRESHSLLEGENYGKLVLDITVCCRSNDLIWGTFSANCVQFSVLLEYLAGRLGVGMGKYVQFSHNCHMYLATQPKLVSPYFSDYPNTHPIGKDWSVWDRDLQWFMQWTELLEPGMFHQGYPDNPWFEHTAQPLFITHHLWKQGKRLEAYDYLISPPQNIAPDWRLAAEQWMKRRLEKAK